VLLFADPAGLTGDALINYRIVERSHIPLSVHITDVPPIPADGWVVDALFGTGLTGPLKPPFDRVVEGINAGGSPVLAVDIPSGLDCDTGEPLGPTVRAAHTVTFVAVKKGFANPSAAPFLGQVHVADIGAPRALLEAFAAPR
jgi:NAD(P)H-hydrate epimerase